MASKIAKESVTGINNAEPLQGWQSYGPWAYALDGPTFGYLLDEKLRVYSHVGELGNSILRSKPYAAKIEMLKDTPGVDRMGQPIKILETISSINQILLEPHGNWLTAGGS